MISNETKIKILQNRINVAESKKNGEAGVVRKWKRLIRNMEKAN